MKALILITLCTFTFISVVNANDSSLNPEQIKKCESHAQKIADFSGEKVEKVLWTLGRLKTYCEVYFEIPFSYRYADDGCSGANRVITLRLDDYTMVYDFFQSFDCGRRY